MMLPAVAETLEVDRSRRHGERIRGALHHVSHLHVALLFVSEMTHVSDKGHALHHAADHHQGEMILAIEVTVAIAAIEAVMTPVAAETVVTAGTEETEATADELL